nr:putative pentatricopeptide repeat-containing protein At5g52630 [Ipomoea batatas]
MANDNKSGVGGDPRRAHARAITTGDAATNRGALNNLITLYSKSGRRCEALRVFQSIPSPNVVSWTCLISTFHDSTLSFRHFLSMLRHILPNNRTLAALLKTCASLSALSFGLQVHSLARKLGLSSDPFTASALVSFYCKVGFVDHARKVFDEMLDRDEVCFSSMVVGLAQNSRPIEALSYFAEMRRAGVASTMYSVSGALRAASEMAMFEQCRILHGHTVMTGLDLNVVVGSALIDGYGRCGLVREARAMFDELEMVLNVVGWSTMMSGYAQQGDFKNVIELLGSMQERGMKPDHYSFLAVLTAFYHAGLAEEAERWFRRMKEEYGLEPWLEHYTCLIGAMGKAGEMESAETLALTMPFKPDAAVWRALLSTSAYHGKTDFAWKMRDKLLEINPNDDSAYVLLANAFASAGRWDEVKEEWKTMKDKRVRKEGGRSWIEARGEVHVFLAEDRTHERRDEIYGKLAELMEAIERLGYVPVWNEMLHEVDEKQKREALWYHSEKLALAFGLLSGSTPPGKPLRIVKNLRICRDCHEAFKYISRVVDREIIVRDVNRYHTFLNGCCSCGDNW